MKGELMEKQQAIDLLDNLIGMVEDNQENDYDTAFRMAIDALSQPTIQPVPKEGHWIDKGDDGDWAWQIDGRGNTWHVWGCSECGKSVFAKSGYCPHCGAKMRGEQHETD